MSWRIQELSDDPQKLGPAISSPDCRFPGRAEEQMYLFKEEMADFGFGAFSLAGAFQSAQVLNRWGATELQFAELVAELQSVVKPH
jgi:hypothetical protein